MILCGYIGDNMGILSSIGNAIGNFVSGFNPLSWIGDMGSALLQDQLQDSNAKDAYNRSIAASGMEFDRNVYAYQNRYNWTMQDMEKAGLNPILAASTGYQVGSGPVSGSAQSFMSGGAQIKPFSDSMVNTASAYKQGREGDRVAAEIQELTARADKQKEEAKVAMEDVLKKRSEKGVNVAKERVLVQTMFNLEQEFLYKVQMFTRLQAEISNITADTNQKKALTEKIADERRLLRNQSKQIEYYLSELKRISDAYEGPAGGILGYVNAISKALNLHIGFGGYSGSTESTTTIRKER